MKIPAVTARCPQPAAVSLVLRGAAVRVLRGPSGLKLLGPTTLGRVTAEAASDQAQPHPLLPGASPATIRSWLVTDEDRDRFLEDFAAALDRARDELDLTAVHEALEEWRRIAVLQTDRAGFRRTVRYAAEQATGHPSPEDEPLAVTRAKAGI